MDPNSFSNFYQSMLSFTNQTMNNMNAMLENVADVTSQNSPCLKWEESAGGDGKFYFCFGEGTDLVPGDTCESGWIECDPADYVVDDAEIQAEVDRFNSAFEDAMEDDALAAIEFEFGDDLGFLGAEFVDAEDQDAAAEEPAEEAQASEDDNTLPENSQDPDPQSPPDTSSADSQDPDPQSPLGDQASPSRGAEAQRSGTTGEETGETTAESSEDDEGIPILTILIIVAVLLFIVCIGVAMYKSRNNASAKATLSTGTTETTTDVAAEY